MREKSPSGLSVKLYKYKFKTMHPNLRYRSVLLDLLTPHTGASVWTDHISCLHYAATTILIAAAAAGKCHSFHRCCEESPEADAKRSHRILNLQENRIGASQCRFHDRCPYIIVRLWGYGVFVIPGLDMMSMVQDK